MFADRDAILSSYELFAITKPDDLSRECLGCSDCLGPCHSLLDLLTFLPSRDHRGPN